MHYQGTFIPARNGTLAAPRPRIPANRQATGGRTLIQTLLSLAGASGLVLLVPFAILLVGVPVALVVRWLAEAIGWLFNLVFL